MDLSGVGRGLGVASSPRIPCAEQGRSWPLGNAGGEQSKEDSSLVSPWWVRFLSWAWEPARI